MPELQRIKKQSLVLKEILNASWDGIAIISKTSKFIYANKAITPLFAYNEKEILKINFIDLLDEDDAFEFKDLLKSSIDDTYKNKKTFTCRRKDNKTIYVSVSVKLMSNNEMFVLNISDVTESKSKDILVDTFLMQLDLNIDGFITHISEAFCSMTSYTKNEIIGLSYTDILASMTVPFQKQSLETSIKEKKNNKVKLVIKNNNNTTFNAQATLHTILNKYGDVIGFSMILINTSSIKSNEEIQLKKMLIDEEEKLAIMTETMRTVAHEWRQPLNSISLTAQELLFNLDFEDDIQKEEIKEHLSSIASSTQDLSSIIENFQEITELKGSKKKRNIKDVVLEAIKISNLEQDYIEFNHEPTKAFRTYPKELASAFSVILINAKEILEGKKDKKIFIHTFDDGANIVCEISNNGGHIPEEIIEKIFTPYFSTKKEKNGVGLSLYVCKIIVELHLKGTIEVVNEEDDIVKFILKFPKEALEE